MEIDGVRVQEGARKIVETVGNHNFACGIPARDNFDRPRNPNHGHAMDHRDR